jgi:hypothetical protein
MIQLEHSPAIVTVSEPATISDRYASFVAPGQARHYENLNVIMPELL